MAKNRQLLIQGVLIAKQGERLALTLSYREIQITAYQEVVQTALKQPMTREKLIAPISKTGDTFYSFDSLIVEMEENIFVPVAWLNEIRREAIKLLMDAMADQYKRINQITESVIHNYTQPEQAEKPGICVSCQREEQFVEVLSQDEVTSIYVDYDTFDINNINKLAVKAKEKGKEVYLSLPHICRLAQYNRLKEDLNNVIDNNAISGFVVKNFEEIELLQSLKVSKQQKKLITNYNMYTYNTEAKSFFQELGISLYTAPVELNYQELKTLGIWDSDFIVYGYQPVMISAQCLFESTVGCKKCKEGNTGNLVDRLGKSFLVQANCNGCYNTIYNGQPLSLLKYRQEINDLSPRNIRLDFTFESVQEVRNILSAYVSAFCGTNKAVTDIPDYTTGHFKRGVE
jgi:putative protease